MESFSKPYFSIVIPTKDRVELAKNVVFHNLAQTNQDFEIVLVDNGESTELYEWAVDLNDPRIQPYRSGGLSMPDNWQFAFEKCRGEVVLMSEDKIFLQQDTLQKCSEAFKKSDAKFITWCIGYEPSHPQYEKTNTSGYNKQHSDELIKFALEGRLDLYQKTAPRAINMAVRRSFALDVQKKVGRLCVPISPDYSFGSFLLAESDFYLHTYDKFSYILHGAPSNGTEVMKGSEKGKKFFMEMGISLEDYVASMPCKTPLFGNMLLADILEFWNKTRLGNLTSQINLKSYWLMILSEILLARKMIGIKSGLAVSAQREIKALPVFFRFKLFFYLLNRFYTGWPNRKLKMRKNFVDFLGGIKVLIIP